MLNRTMVARKEILKIQLAKLQSVKISICDDCYEELRIGN